MEYITSRSFQIPDSFAGMAEALWFNMWRRRQWPYRELLKGDTLYWYENKQIVWNTKITEIDRFAYASKIEAANRLTERFNRFDDTDQYYLKAPDSGYCLAYKVQPIEKLALPKPDNVDFPYLGWLAFSDELARIWLGRSHVIDMTTLDESGHKGTAFERLRQAEAAMADVVPERIQAVVSQTIRRDTRLIEALKEVFNYRCQFPGCNVRIPKRGGGYYIEVAHILPVSKGGQSRLGNLLVLCPNHHKEMDLGDLQIEEQTVECLKGKLNGRRFTINVPGSTPKHSA